MSRPDSPHVTSLKRFRDRLVEARREAVATADFNAALTRFVQIQGAIDLYDAALNDEQDLTPLPPVDNPVAPERKL